MRIAGRARGMNRMIARSAWVLVLGTACGTPTTGGGGTTVAETPAGEAPTGVLMEQDGALAADDMQVGQAFSDHYELAVRAGDSIIVDLTSSAFDPVLEVTPPGQGALVNDDFEGDRARSRVNTVVSADGVLKIRVTSYGQGATGDYHIRVASADVPVTTNVAAAPSTRAVITPVLSAGSPLRGALDASDPRQEDGRPFEVIVVHVEAGRAQTLSIEGVPEALVVDPQGRYLRVTGGTVQLAQTGTYRVQLVGAAGESTPYAVSLGNAAAPAAETHNNPSLARDHHQAPAGGNSTPIQVGQRVTGAIAASDPSLPSGESADVYTFTGQPGHEVSIEMESTELDSYVMVFGPQGEMWENDDSGGGLNASVTVPVPSQGTYRVVATTYRAGMTGAYELKVFAASRQASVAPRRQPHPTPSAATQSGTLGEGDGQLQSGEFVDRFDVQLQAGQRLELALSSTEFDTYLIVRGPDGTQQQNDDIQSGNTNSALSYAVQQSGLHQVLVTSYRPGETGAYTLQATGAALVAAGAPAANPANPGTNPGTNPPAATPGLDRRTGALAQGDSQLDSGEFSDRHEITLPPHASVRIQLQSREFDTYLIVRDPSGHAQDNDDVTPGNTDSALDVRTTAGGAYTVVVTSYRPGETGNYELLVQGGGAPAVAPTPTPTPRPGTRPPAVAAGTIRGALARGDGTLPNGEFVDEHTIRLTQGQPAQVRVESDNFDTYLIVRTPSGRQLENDDIAPGVLHSGVDIPSAEAGEYTVLVTSYRAGETGRYTLRSGQNLGPAVQAAPSPGGTPTGGGGNFYGIFTGISDYPGNGNDLPECANDAIKLAESLRESGLMPAANQIVLTDAQVTVAGVQQAFERMGQQVQPNDTFMFFYSGHGSQRGQSQDERELDGIDETVVFYDGQVVDDTMGEWFNAIQGLGVLALDACFSGGFAKDVITQPGRMGLFSSEEDVLSSVAGQFQAGGYLSHFLRTGISGEADNAPHDRVLTAGELSHYLFNQFGTHVRDVQLNGAWQHLVVDRGAVRSDMTLLSYAR